MMFIYPFNFNKSCVEDKCSIWWDDLTDTALAVPQMGRNGDPPSLPKTHVYQSTVHASYDTTMAQGDNVWRVVIKTIKTNNIMQMRVQSFIL